MVFLVVVVTFPAQLIVRTTNVTYKMDIALHANLDGLGCFVIQVSCLMIFILDMI